MYDSGKNAGKGFLSGLESQERQIQRLMDRIAKGMVQAIERVLGLPGGGVMHHHGMRAARDLMQGAYDGTRMAAYASAGTTPGRGSHVAPPGGRREQR